MYLYIIYDSTYFFSSYKNTKQNSTSPINASGVIQAFSPASLPSPPPMLRQ